MDQHTAEAMVLGFSGRSGLATFPVVRESLDAGFGRRSVEPHPVTHSEDRVVVRSTVGG